MGSNSPFAPLRVDYEGTGAYALIAEGLNAIGRIINNVELVGPGEVTVSRDGIRIRTEFGPWAQMPLWYAQEGSEGETITVYEGNLRIHGSKNIEIEEAEVTLTSTPTWIYVEHDRVSDAATIQKATSEPETTPTLLRWPLYKFTYDTDIERYTLDDQGLRRFDIQLDTPLRT